MSLIEELKVFKNTKPKNYLESYDYLELQKVMFRATEEPIITAEQNNPDVHEKLIFDFQNELEQIMAIPAEQFIHYRNKEK